MTQLLIVAVALLARQSAESWLPLLDAKRYDESWQQSASAFKQEVPQDRWAESIKATQAPLGPLKHRQFTTARYVNEHLIIQFIADYQNRYGADEIVFLTHEENTWRPAGHFLH